MYGQHACSWLLQHLCILYLVELWKCWFCDLGKCRHQRESLGYDYHTVTHRFLHGLEHPQFDGDGFFHSSSDGSDHPLQQLPLVLKERSKVAPFGDHLCLMSRNLKVNCQPEDTRDWGQWHRNPARFQVWVLPLATKPEMLTWHSCKKVNIGEWGFFKKVLPRGHLRRTGRWGVDLRDSSAMHPPWQSVNFTIIVVVIECQWPLPFM